MHIYFNLQSFNHLPFSNNKAKCIHSNEGKLQTFSLGGL